MNSRKLLDHRLRNATSRQSGTVLVVALVCLLVITAIIGTMLGRTLLDQRQLHMDRDLRQTQLLLEAGIARAAARTIADSNYRNETWNLPPDAITNSGEGRVTINVSPNAGRTAFTATVIAEYPIGRRTSIRRSRTVQLSSGQEK